MHLDVTHQSCYKMFSSAGEDGERPAFPQSEKPPDMDRRCDQPWRDLFLWAILQNRQEMANYFWAMVSQLTNMSDELIFIN